MIVAGFDLETTGLDTDTDLVTEAAVVLWDTELRRPVKIFSELICPAGKTIPKGVSDIDQETVARWGGNSADVLGMIAQLFSYAELCVAHNGVEFDSKIMQAEFVRNSIAQPKILLADTLFDVEWDGRWDCTSSKLGYIAYCHGIVNPFPHRALFDVMTMLSLADLYDWQKIKNNAKSPLVKVIALTSYAEKDLAKDAKFRWDGDSKTWSKTMRQSQLDKQKYPFKIKTVPYADKLIG